MKNADSLERWCDPTPGRRLAGGSENLKILSPGQVVVEPGLVDDGPDSCQRRARCRGTG